MFVIKCLLFIKIIQGLEVYQGEVVGYPTICLPSPPPLAYWGLIFAPIRISQRKDSIQATSLINIKSKTMITGGKHRWITHLGSVDCTPLNIVLIKVVLCY